MIAFGAKPCILVFVNFFFFIYLLIYCNLLYSHEVNFMMNGLPEIVPNELNLLPYYICFYLRIYITHPLQT